MKKEHTNKTLIEKAGDAYEQINFNELRLAIIINEKNMKKLYTVYEIENAYEEAAKKGCIYARLRENEIAERHFIQGANWQATQQQGLESIVGFVLEWVAERAGTKPDGDFGRDGEYYEREIIDKEGILIMKADIIKELTQLNPLKQ